MKKRKKQTISFACPVYDDKEINAVTRVLTNKQILPGKHIAEFEKKVAKIFGKKYGVMVNSGSSANLLAIAALDLPKGAEVITPIVTFGTLISPIVQHQLVPVFVDVNPNSYQLDIDQVERAITKKTRAIFFPSLLGNTPDLECLRKLARKHNLVLIDDSCDTLGATFKGKPTGTYTDISTTSFFGAHIITGAGGGGTVCCDDEDLYWKLKTLRGWGRRASPTAESPDTLARYTEELLGEPYDEKFLYDEAGYNVLPTEVSAAFGLVQLTRLKQFTKARKKNFDVFSKFFAEYDSYFHLPEQHPHIAHNNWLAFPITVRNDAPFSHFDLVTHLEKNGIQTLPLFSGNITLHPWMQKVKYRAPFKTYPAADEITRGGIKLPCHQGLDDAARAYILDVFTEFLETYA